jgi:hypothetical protein
MKPSMSIFTSFCLVTSHKNVQYSASMLNVWQPSHVLILPKSRSVRHSSGAHDQISFTVSCRFVDVEHLLWWEHMSVVENCCWTSRGQPFSGLSPTGLMAIVFCLRFETSPTWRARSPLFISQRTAKSESKLNYDWWSISQSVLVSGTHLEPVNNFPLFLIIFRQLWVCWCRVPSLMGGQVCSFQLSLGLIQVVFFGSDSRRTHDSILLSQICDSPSMEALVPLFISPRNRAA